MISRHWTGISRRDRADACIRHLQSETFPALVAMAGFVSASTLKQEVLRGIEFHIVTVWESLEAIRAFAGEDAEDDRQAAVQMVALTLRTLRQH